MKKTYKSVVDSLHARQRKLSKFSHSLGRRLETASTATQVSLPSHVVDRIYSTRLDSRHFRLLKLTPSTVDTDDLQLTLEPFEMTEAPPYFALSHTWGDPEDLDNSKEEGAPRQSDAMVCVNGSRTPVTQNLFDGLCALRKKNIDSYIWIDAICINQEDVSERNTQVSIMDRIYQNAAQVLVWLGPDIRQEAPKVMELVQKLSLYCEERTSNRGNLDFSATGHEIARDAGFPGLRAKYDPQSEDQILLWKLLVMFLGRRWFCRRWVIQEVALARDIRVFCGDTEYKWLEIARSCAVMGTDLGDTLGAIFAIHKMESVDETIHGDDQVFLYYSPAKSFSGIQSMSLLCTGNDGNTSVYIDATSWLFTRLGGRIVLKDNLSGLIIWIQHATTEHLASEARDTVYGILGIISAAARFYRMQAADIEVDYTKPIESVYMDIAKCVLGNTKLLSYLSFVQDVPFRTLSGLPSWIPEFTSTKSTPLLISDKTLRDTLFDATKCYSRPGTATSFSINGNNLHCRGFSAGVVTQVSQPLRHLVNATLPASRHDLGQHLDHIAGMVLGCQDVYPTGQSRVEALWRTLIFDTTASSSPASQELAASFRYWLVMLNWMAHNREAQTAFSRNYYDVAYKQYDLLARSDLSNTVPDRQALENFAEEMHRDADATSIDIDAKASAYYRLTMKSMVYRSFFITEHGYMCVGPDSTKPGDSVWILDGGPIPFVLHEASRKISKADKAHHSSMTLVGECYVHGIMHGEALEKDEFAWQDISLV